MSTPPNHPGPADDAAEPESEPFPGAQPGMPGGRVDLAGPVHVSARAMRLTFSRSSGPGGQSVNKVSTAATLHVPIGAIQGLDRAARARLCRLAGQRIRQDGVLVIQAREHRSQIDNRRACLERLREMIRQALIVPKKRKASKPSRGSIERRLKSKREHAQKKQRRQRPQSDG